jgi:hypothetical protein
LGIVVGRSNRGVDGALLGLLLRLAVALLGWAGPPVLAKGSTARDTLGSGDSAVHGTAQSSLRPGRRGETAVRGEDQLVRLALDGEGHRDLLGPARLRPAVALGSDELLLGLLGRTGRWSPELDPLVFQGQVVRHSGSSSGLVTVPDVDVGVFVGVAVSVSVLCFALLGLLRSTF